MQSIILGFFAVVALALILLFVLGMTVVIIGGLSRRGMYFEFGLGGNDEDDDDGGDWDLSTLPKDPKYSNRGPAPEDDTE